MLLVVMSIQLLLLKGRFILILVIPAENVETELDAFTETVQMEHALVLL
jgi:hypothetical protein